MSEVTVVIGAGQIGQAIARRVSAGKHVLLADLHQANADAAARRHRLVLFRRTCPRMIAIYPRRWHLSPAST